MYIHVCIHMFLKGTCKSEAEAGHRASGQQKDSKPCGRSARGTTKVAWQGRPQRKDQSQHASIEHMQGHTRSTSHKETTAQAMNQAHTQDHKVHGNATTEEATSLKRNTQHHARTTGSPTAREAVRHKRQSNQAKTTENHHRRPHRDNQATTATELYIYIHIRGPARLRHAGPMQHPDAYIYIYIYMYISTRLYIHIHTRCGRFPSQGHSGLWCRLKMTSGPGS